MPVYTDGESIIYRSDRPGRPGQRNQPGSRAFGGGGPSVARPPEPEWPVERPARPEAPVARIDRLEAEVARLEGLVSRLERVLAGLTEAVAAVGERGRPVPPPARRQPPADSGEAVRLLTVPAAPQAAEQSDVKVSLYAGGGATAVLGQIRIQRGEED